ncbi:hypothetical protein CDN98_12375 [Roseateles terrae]|nr:hypothetical protein CDN98_12375 [Roseateles terrae]
MAQNAGALKRRPRGWAVEDCRRAVESEEREEDFIAARPDHVVRAFILKCKGRLCTRIRPTTGRFV